MLHLGITLGIFRARNSRWWRVTCWREWPLRRALRINGGEEGITKGTHGEKAGALKEDSDFASLLFFQLQSTYIILVHVHHRVIRHVCSLLSDHPDESSTHLTSYSVQYHWLYFLCCTLHPRGYIYNWQCVLLNATTFFIHPPTLFPPGIHQLSASMGLFLYCFFILCLEST